MAKAARPLHVTGERERVGVRGGIVVLDAGRASYGPPKSQRVEAGALTAPSLALWPTPSHSE